MDDQDLINLQKLAGRGPQPSPFEAEPPYHVQLAQALAQMGGGPAPPDPDADEYRQMLAEAVANHGGPSGVPLGGLSGNSSARRVQLVSYSVPGPVSGTASRGPLPDPTTHYAMGLPAEVDLPWQHMADQYTPEPKPAPPSSTPPTAATSAVQTTIDPIPGFDQTGDNAWRAANDKIFLDAVNRHNAANGYRPGDPGYWTADMLKAQAMRESGGDEAVFLSDPLQVNTFANWDDHKHSIAGLTRGQTMTPAISADAALKWLQYKGWRHDAAGKAVQYLGDDVALQRYRGDPSPDPSSPGMTVQQSYARRVRQLAESPARTRPPAR